MKNENNNMQYVQFYIFTQKLSVQVYSVLFIDVTNMLKKNGQNKKVFKKFKLFENQDVDFLR